MRSVLSLAMSLSLLSLSGAYAGDGDREPCGVSPAEDEVQVDRSPRNSAGQPAQQTVMDSPSFPKLGYRFRIDWTDAGTRHHADVLRSYLKPNLVNVRETVVRVYDDDGRQYEERKIRFQSRPRDLLLDKKGRSEAIDGPQAYATHDVSTPDYAPLFGSPDVRLTPFPSRCE